MALPWGFTLRTIWRGIIVTGERCVHLTRYALSCLTLAFQISRLYRPLNVEDDFSDEEDLEAGAQLLPTHVESAATRDVSKPPTKGSRLADVWDEGEELFDIGAESEEEGEASHPRESPPIAHLPDTTR